MLRIRGYSPLTGYSKVSFQLQAFRDHDRLVGKRRESDVGRPPPPREGHQGRAAVIQLLRR